MTSANATQDRADAADRTRGRWMLAIAVVFTVLPFGAGPAGAAEGSALRQVVWGTMFSAAALFLLLNADRGAVVLRTLEPWFVALLMYVGLTILWSPEPYVSFKRYVQVIGVVIIALSVAARGMPSGKTLRMLRTPLTALLLLSLVVVAAFPSYGITDTGWRGLSATKNTFGQLALLAALTWYFTDDRKHRWVRFGAIGVAVVALGLSRSLTAMLTFAAVLAYLGAPAVLRAFQGSWRGPLLGLAMLLLVGADIAVLAGGNIAWDKLVESTFRLVGRDSTLSGRSQLWELMMAEVAKHPWFGVGYGGFWLGLEGAAGQIAYIVRWGYPGQAHNGYIDLLNELGVTGLTLVACAIAAHVRRLVSLAAVDREAARFHAALLVAILTLNLTEASILRTTHLWWIAFTLSVIEVGVLQRRSGLQAIDTAPAIYRIPA